MTPVKLPIASTTSQVAQMPPQVDESWTATVRWARALSWISLAWMAVEGIVGLVAGLDTGALSVIVWASSSFVEGLASIIVIWRFTGSRMRSADGERVAQRLVAGSFLLLVPFFVYAAIHRLVGGGDPHPDPIAIAVTASAIVLMPFLGWAKLRLGARLDSGATAGEGIQNLFCATQAAAALVALACASAGLGVVDPLAAVLVGAIAAKEAIDLWRGQAGDCCAPIGFADRTDDTCCDDC